MDWMTKDMSSHIKSTRKRYWNHLYKEKSVETAVQYAELYNQEEKMSDLVNGNTQDQIVADVLKESHKDIFCRNYPFQNQPFMMISVNPGMPSLDRYLGGEGLLYNCCPTHGDRLSPNQMARIGAHDIVDWMYETHLPGLFRAIVEHDYDSSIDADILQKDIKDWDPEQYFQLDTANDWFEFATEAGREAGPSWLLNELSPPTEIDLDRGFFSDFYYTSGYKLSTPSANDEMFDFPSSLSQLQIEIEIADPEVLFVTGGIPYKQILELYESNMNPLGEGVMADGIMEARNSIFEVTAEDGPEYIMTLRHPNYLGNYDEAATQLAKTDALI